jgi:exodeoxyribonuclease VII large subunit
LILARGGGSLEDLWSFNEEVVAHAIYDCRIPIVSGIGHEIDFTIADFVADVRAPTPSGAAELVVPDCQTWLQALSVVRNRLLNALRRKLTRERDSFAWLKNRLGQLHPGIQLRQRAQRLDELEQRLARTLQFGVDERQHRLNVLSARLQTHSPLMQLARARTRLEQLQIALGTLTRHRMHQLRSRLAVATRALDTLSPLATLTRGYAIVTDAQGHAVMDAGNLQPGETIRARFSKGNARATVNEVQTDDQ